MAKFEISGNVAAAIEMVFSAMPIGRTIELVAERDCVALDRINPANIIVLS